VYLSMKVDTVKFRGMHEKIGTNARETLELERATYDPNKYIKL